MASPDLSSKRGPGADSERSSPQLSPYRGSVKHRDAIDRARHQRAAAQAAHRKAGSTSRLRMGRAGGPGPGHVDVPGESRPVSEASPPAAQPAPTVDHARLRV